MYVLRRNWCNELALRKLYCTLEKSLQYFGKEIVYLISSSYIWYFNTYLKIR